MLIDLAGKVVLVTGGSRGIGAAIVRTVGAAGADVVLHYGRSRDAAERVAAELGAAACHLVAADLAMPGAAARLWRHSVDWRGRVDVLVNNAAIATTVTVEDSGDAWAAAWEQTLQVNLVSLADLCREAILHYRARAGTETARKGPGIGTIINIASRAAHRGDDPGYMHYAASKAGVVALTKSIARGFGREGVLAYAVAPGWVLTDMAEQTIKTRGMAELTRDIPLGTMAPPEDVAHVVAFLAAGLAPHATGTTIDINGASYVR
jgi:3-oxoacyl-[acyl-carrier protein] reductase